MSHKSHRPDPGDLLRRASHADQKAINELMPVLYDELRRIARNFMADERKGHTLQATVLVHEAYVRLIEQRNANPEDRTHFFAMASNIIRRVLVDHARKRGAAKRGRDWEKVSLGDVDPADKDGDIDLLGLHEALEKLASVSDRAAQVVTMRYFAGMSVEEIARVLEISPRTVAGEWAMARAWLRRELDGRQSEDSDE